MYLQCMIFTRLDCWIIWAQKTDHHAVKKKRMLSVRGQHLLLLDLLWVLCPTSMTESWESLQWVPKNRRGSVKEVTRKQKTPETVAHSQEETHDNQAENMAHREESPGVGDFHGGFGSASLRECVNLATNGPSGFCHSEGSARESTPHMTNPSQVMSPNVEQNPPQDVTPKHEPPPENADQRPKKRERKEEDLTRKSEPEQAEAKEEQEDLEENLPRRRPSDPFPRPLEVLALEWPYVESAAGGWAEPCDAPGCRRELHCCCSECLARLCNLHAFSPCTEHNSIIAQHAEDIPCPTPPPAPLLQILDIQGEVPVPVKEPLCRQCRARGPSRHVLQPRPSMVSAAAETITEEMRGFTPSIINEGRCLACVWNSGKGGQCRAARPPNASFCRQHAQCQAHGVVTGPIPMKKLMEFRRANAGN